MKYIQTKQIDMICSKCKKSGVLRDAFAIWNVELQEWELQNVFDEAFCEYCGTSVIIEEKEVSE